MHLNVEGNISKKGTIGIYSKSIVTKNLYSKIVNMSKSHTHKLIQIDKMIYEQFLLNARRI